MVIKERCFTWIKLSIIRFINVSIVDNCHVTILKINDVKW